MLYMFMDCQWLATGGRFSPGTPISSTNKTDCHNNGYCNWNIVKSGIKHHKTNQKSFYLVWYTILLSPLGESIISATGNWLL